MFGVFVKCRVVLNVAKCVVLGTDVDDGVDNFALSVIVLDTVRIVVFCFRSMIVDVIMTVVVSNIHIVI